MMYARAGYVIPRSDLDAMGEELMGVVMGEWDSIDPYNEKIREVFNTSEASQKFTKFDKVFSEVEIVSLERISVHGGIRVIRIY
jgi:hypothetical protein